MRGGFALQRALASVIRGVASLSDDQLDECRERLFEADRLVEEASDPPWVGKNVIRGVTQLMGGCIQCMQHSFAKGVWNVLSSWKYISCLEAEALHYQGTYLPYLSLTDRILTLHPQGLERETVRSSALSESVDPTRISVLFVVVSASDKTKQKTSSFCMSLWLIRHCGSAVTLAIFNLLMSVLPPSMLKAAQWLSGFEGDRAVALQQLKDCYEEEGLLAPWAAVVLCAYHIDVKTFLGEQQSEADFDQCEEILEWAAARYPGSIFFRGLEADLSAARKNVHRASELSASIDKDIGELKAMRWVTNYKRGIQLGLGLGTNYRRGIVRRSTDIAHPNSNTDREACTN